MAKWIKNVKEEIYFCLSNRDINNISAEMEKMIKLAGMPFNKMLDRDHEKHYVLSKEIKNNIHWTADLGVTLESVSKPGLNMYSLKISSAIKEDSDNILSTLSSIDGVEFISLPVGILNRDIYDKYRSQLTR